MESRKHLFGSLYRGLAPWDIGRPQEAVRRLESLGRFRGTVLDAGCGPGDNACYLASRGHEVWGIDFIPAAIEQAREKAKAQKARVTFRVADAFALEALGRRFASVLDSGLFHIFDEPSRYAYAAGLRRALVPGGTLNLLCFSDREPGDWGPRRLSEAELLHHFGAGWWIELLERTRFENLINPYGSHAWLLSARLPVG